MNSETLNALKESIKHHRENLKANDPAEVNIYGQTCPLCKLFCNSGTMRSTKDCIGCPVYNKTGIRYCHGTPWQELYGNYCNWISIPESEELKEKFMTSEQEEIDYLIELLPEGETI